MKKVLLSLAVIFVMYSFTTTNLEKENNKKIKVEENVGRDCVDRAMEWVYDAVDAGIGDGELNGDYYDDYMSIYMFYYKECMKGFSYV